MQIERMLREELAFDEDAVKVLSAVYDDVVNSLSSEGHTHLSAETIAKKIIRYAWRDRRDPIKVRDAVLRECDRLPLAGRTMPRDHAYELMRNALKAVLPSVETFARMAKSAPAKKNLIKQIGQITEALKAAEQAGSAMKDRASLKPASGPPR